MSGDPVAVWAYVVTVWGPNGVVHGATSVHTTFTEAHDHAVHSWKLDSDRERFDRHVNLCQLAPSGEFDLFGPVLYTASEGYQ